MITENEIKLTRALDYINDARNNTGKLTPDEWIMASAYEVILSDKDTRIADLEKERDEARKDAKIASHIANEYMEKYCDRIRAIPFEVCNSERVTVSRIMEKYK